MRVWLRIGLFFVFTFPTISEALSAEPATVVVVPFTGLHADEPQAAVLQALGPQAALVPAAKASQMHPRVTVFGAVEKQNGLKLNIRVVDSNGGQSGTLVVPVPAARHLPPDQLGKVGADVKDLVAQALAATQAPAAPAPSAPPPVEAPAKQATDIENAPLTGNPESWSAHGPSTTSAATVKSAWLARFSLGGPRPGHYPFVIARAGAIVTSRALDFSPGQPPIFHGGTAGGVHAEVELYPFAFTHALARGVFAGLGGWFAVDKPFWLTTTLDGSTNQYDTDELRLEGGARWRFVLRKLAPLVELTVFGGAGLHSFTIAKTTSATGTPVDAGPPDARYVYGVVGIESRVHLFGDRIAPFVKVGYEYVPDAGPTENLDEYGLSDTHGFQLRGGLEARVWRKLTVGASAFWEYLSLNFQNNVPTARNASGATDQYYGALFTVGWAL
jgi:hypothetical protein